MAVPSSILIVYYFSTVPTSEDGSLINQSSINSIHPTPNSEISLLCSVREREFEAYYLYEYNFTFAIIKGIELNFMFNDRLFNRTQLYLSIKANHGLEFYSAIFVMNITEFQADDSQVKVHTEMDESLRFENLIVEVHYSSISEEDGSIILIRGSRQLFTKEQVITVENISDFSGNWHFRINENSYNLSYVILPDLTLNYSLNSSIGVLELLLGQISILGRNGTHSIGIGSLGFPYAPGSPGYYSESGNITLIYGYQQISFELTIGVDIAGIDVEYEIIPTSEIQDQQQALEDAQRRNLWKTLLNSSVITILGFLTILGCLVNYSKNR